MKKKQKKTPKQYGKNLADKLKARKARLEEMMGGKKKKKKKKKKKQP